MADKKRKHKKRLTVAMEAVGEAPDKAAPFVGYFPTGYDPTADGSGDPSVAIFRNKRKPNRAQLAVRPSGSTGVEFVGTNYSGEATASQICNYAIGVLDKESQTLKIVPIASNKIFRLDPHFVQLSEAKPYESAVEDSDKVERHMQDLTSLYGTKKDRDKDKKWKSLFQQLNEPTTDENMESHKNDSDMETEVNENTSVATVRNIPPHDLSADTPERAYPLDGIIPHGERIHLFEIFEDLQSGEDFAAKGYPSFVSNRIEKLKAIKDEEEQERMACIFSYITHLVSFWQRNSPRHSKSTTFEHPKIPRIVYQKLLSMFVDGRSNTLSIEKNELLIEYILVLTLFADNFLSDPSDIAKDLKMTVKSLKPYYQQLGCRARKDSPVAPFYMTLPVPLKFQDLRKRARR